jgi:hypothetical protein
LVSEDTRENEQQSQLSTSVRAMDEKIANLAKQVKSLKQWAIYVLVPAAVMLLLSKGKW